MFDTFTVEICAGGIEDVITASRFPIDRIELNCALELGGLTPSVSVLKAAKKHTSVPVLCMVRPRAAGFVYSENECRIMMEDARVLLEAGADGIVFGFLNPDHSVNKEKTAEMVSLIHSYGKTAVFHRAFDLTPDPVSAVQTLISCNVDRILTSGHEETAYKGIPCIKSLIEQYGDQIEILPGCGITADNVQEILQKTGASQFHMTAKSDRHDSGSYPAVDARNIQAVYQKLFHNHETRSTLLTREDTELMREELYEKQFD